MPGPARAAYIRADSRAHVLHMQYSSDMSKMIQIRNVPDALHRKLKQRAANNGMSLSDYLLSELRQAAEVPTLREWQQNLEKRRPVKLGVPAAELIRAERDAR